MDLLKKTEELNKKQGKRNKANIFFYVLLLVFCFFGMQYVVKLAFDTPRGAVYSEFQKEPEYFLVPPKNKNKKKYEKVFPSNKEEYNKLLNGYWEKLYISPEEEKFESSIN